MDMRTGPTRVGAPKSIPVRRQLSELRQQVARALDDDWENPQFPLDELDLSWLSTLPRTLPRGSILNVLV